MVAITLPQYIVEKVSSALYAIWDTVNHEYTGFEFTPEDSEDPKKAASTKAQEINAKSMPYGHMQTV